MLDIFVAVEAFACICELYLLCNCRCVKCRYNGCVLKDDPIGASDLLGDIGAKRSDPSDHVLELSRCRIDVVCWILVKLDIKRTKAG